MSALVKQLALAQPACNCPASSTAPTAAVQLPQNSATFDSGAGVNTPVSEALDTNAGNSTALPDVDSDGRPNRFGIDDLKEKFSVKVAHRVVCRCDLDHEHRSFVSSWLPLFNSFDLSSPLNPFLSCSTLPSACASFCVAAR
jgi:hypothetical protein